MKESMIRLYRDQYRKKLPTAVRPLLDDTRYVLTSSRLRLSVLGRALEPEQRPAWSRCPSFYEQHFQRLDSSPFMAYLVERAVVWWTGAELQDLIAANGVFVEEILQRRFFLVLQRHFAPAGLKPRRIEVPDAQV